MLNTYVGRVGLHIYIYMYMYIYIYRVAILCSDRLPARYIRVFMFKWRLLATDHHLPFYINTAKEVLKWIDDVRDMLIDERYHAAREA